jgi:hypothetical protein
MQVAVRRAAGWEGDRSDLLHRIVHSLLEEDEERVSNVEEVEVEAERDIFSVITSAISSRSRTLISSILEVGGDR